jgi:pyruvate-formate lyase-activating enzyme
MSNDELRRLQKETPVTYEHFKAIHEYQNFSRAAEEIRFSYNDPFVQHDFLKLNK